MKKILMACSWGNRTSVAGRGSFFFDQARILIEAGFEVEMLFVNYIFGIRNPIQSVASYRMDGIPCHFVEARSIVPRKAWLNIPFHGIQLSRKLRRLDIMNPDFLICQSMMELSHLGPILSDKWNCHTCFIEHHSAFTSKGSFQEPETLPMRIKRVRKSGIPVFAVSRFLSVELEEFRGLSDVKSLFNPVPIQLTKRPFVSISQVDKIEFICIGRFDSNKRIDDVVRAFLDFERSGGKGRLKVITDKGGEEILGELIESQPRCAVELSFEYGSVDRESIFQLIENSHVLISWSQYETFGMTILEALSLGRPVIASNSGGAQDLVNDQNGWTSLDGSVSSLSSLMHRAVEDYDHLSLEEIKSTVLSQFNPIHWMNALGLSSADLPGQ